MFNDLTVHLYFSFPVFCCCTDCLRSSLWLGTLMSCNGILLLLIILLIVSPILKLYCIRYNCFSSLHLNSFHFLCAAAGSFHYMTSIPFLIVLYKAEVPFIQLFFVHSVSSFFIHGFINILHSLDLVQIWLDRILG